MTLATSVRLNSRSGPYPPAEVQPVNLVLKTLDAVTLFVDDPQRSKAFYTTAFGLPVHFEDQNSVVFKFDHVLINLLKNEAAKGLIEPAELGDREGGSRIQFTIEVEEVDAACLELERRGVELLNGPMNRPWGVRTASFMDPDAHIWEIGQRLA
jgi:catechol 2,3-dioxygenase-like lactoylglutathione lyase family enzyme